MRCPRPGGADPEPAGSVPTHGHRGSLPVVVVSVREIEQRTKLDLMPELPTAEQDRLETKEAAMW